jgi:hypothetical protein
MPPDAIAKTPAGQITSSQRMRLQELLAHAAPTERLMLGISYDRLYSRLSRAVHFSTEASPEGPDAVLGHGGGDVSVEGLRFGTVVVARLGVQCLNRLLAQAGIAGGAACQLQRETLASQREDPHSTVLHDLVDGGVRIGDFALVHERLAEVAERAENQFGHVRYRVTYVAERPRNDVAEEWWPASEVHTLFERTQVKGWFAELLAAAPPKQREDFERAGLAAFAGEAWRQSLRDEVLEKLA